MPSSPPSSDLCYNRQITMPILKACAVSHMKHHAKPEILNGTVDS